MNTKYEFAPNGMHEYPTPFHMKIGPMSTPDEILRDMAHTFEERGKVYGDNWKRIGDVLYALAGSAPVIIDGPEAWLRWSLHIMAVTKMTRLATTDLKHEDSAHDLGVYSAMLEAVQREQSRAHP